MAIIAALCAVIVIAGFSVRARYLRAMKEIVSRRGRLGPDGIVEGAEGFSLSRPNAPAVLLVHGAGDTPQTLRYLGEALFAQGFHVEAPLLPGHGRSLAEFSRTTAEEWMDAVRVAYRNLAERHSRVLVVGLSMGGALAVRLAAETPELPALCLLAPYLSLRRSFDLAARTSFLWGLFLPVFQSSEGYSVLDPAERVRNLAYGVFTPAALRALRNTVRRASDALGQVAAPTLMVQSQEDNRIPVADAERAFAEIGAREKRLEWVTGGAHIITVDFGWRHVAQLVIDWLITH